MDSRKRVYSILKSVPEGKVTTYKELANAAGVHQRTVAAYMKTNNDPVGIPCFKVIMSDGKIGGYGVMGPKVKEEMLVSHGVEVVNGKVPEKYIHRF